MILGSFVKKPCFFNDILLSYQFPLVRPSCELGLPKCLPNASQMSPKCFPDASKMPLRWLSDAFQIPDASQMPPKSCYIAFSSMILLHRSHSSMMTKDNSDMNDVFSYMILLHWPLFHDSSSWFRKNLFGVSCWGHIFEPCLMFLRLCLICWCFVEYFRALSSILGLCLVFWGLV